MKEVKGVRTYAFLYIIQSVVIYGPVESLVLGCRRRMTKEKAILLLKRYIDQIRQVKAKARFGATFKKWHRDTSVALGKIFPDEPGHVQEFAKIRYRLSILASSDKQDAVNLLT
jgi:hypothetical protein